MGRSHSAFKAVLHKLLTRERIPNLIKICTILYIIYYILHRYIYIYIYEHMICNIEKL